VGVLRDWVARRCTSGFIRRISLNIEIKRENNIVTIIPEGKIDHTTSVEFEEIIEREASKSDQMILDFDKVLYISSAGLRAILNADEIMSSKQGLKLTNVSLAVYDILAITGFTSVLNIEKK